MSTTPITFERPPPSYTVIGGAERAGSFGVSAILLNRGSRYPRRQAFIELGKAGFDYIISVENPAEHYEIEELSAAFPNVRFILLSEKAGTGTQINIAAQEISTPLFFVLWNDHKILYGLGAEKIAEKMLVPEGAMARNETNNNWYRRICTAPIFQSAQFEQLPATILPVLIKNKFETVPYNASKEDSPVLYPYQGVGVYDRTRFLKIGGFDNEIKDSYWQLMDFGIRCWLWGEEIRCTHYIRLRCDGIQTVESPDYNKSYRRFFLKNIMPVMQNDNDEKVLYAHLPLKKLLSYIIMSKEGLSKGIKNFLLARDWVFENRYNWKSSAKKFIQNWGESA